jgi:hypothetical protein
MPYFALQSQIAPRTTDHELGYRLHLRGVRSKERGQSTKDGAR